MAKKKYVTKPGYLMRPDAAKYIATLLGNEHEKNAWYKRIPELVEEGKIKSEKYGNSDKLKQYETKSIEAYVKEISADIPSDINDSDTIHEKKYNELLNELKVIFKMHDNNTLDTDKTIKAIRENILNSY